MDITSIKEKFSQVLKDNETELKLIITDISSKDKNQILLESRCFNETNINAKHCEEVLIKVLYLINTLGCTFTTNETSDLFFGITKLFQSDNDSLRRMVYLMLSLIKPSQREVFIITSCLIKDMNSNDNYYKANALRVMSKIIDISTASQIERFLRSALVDKDGFVSTSALLCAINLIHFAPDMVKRWSNEIQQLLYSKHDSVQLMSLLVIYELKGSDFLAMHKIITSLINTNVQGSITQCYIIRFASQIVKSEKSKANIKVFLDYIERGLRNFKECVILEACRALCDLACFDVAGHNTHVIFGITDLLACCTILQLFLGSSKNTSRISALRTLYKLSECRPHLVARMNLDLEAILDEKHQCSSTMALSILLRTGNEKSCDKLINQINISNINDQFRYDIVIAVEQLCIQYPQKQKIFLAFLANNLRDGGFRLRSKALNVMIRLTVEIPHCLETVIHNFCEFIEDCEYSSLSCQVLTFIGTNAHRTKDPSIFIPYIYNRLVLEDACIRAAAIDCLCNMTIHTKSLKNDILDLLQICIYDNDDEVRERALIYINVLNQNNLDNIWNDIFEKKIPVDGFLEYYKNDANNYFDTDFELISLNNISEILDKKEDEYKHDPAEETLSKYLSNPIIKKNSIDILFDDIVKNINQKFNINLENKIFSSKSIELTESDSEYLVKLKKHLFKEYLILEINVENTIPKQILQNITPNISIHDKNFKLKGTLPIDSLKFEESKNVYIILFFNNIGFDLESSYEIFLNYSLYDDNGFITVDQYYTDNIELSILDLLVPMEIDNFDLEWKNISNLEVLAKLTLDVKSLEEGMAELIDMLHLSEIKRNQNICYYCTSYMNNDIILLCSNMVYTVEHGLLIKLSIKSNNSNLVNAILNYIE